MFSNRTIIVLTALFAAVMFNGVVFAAPSGECVDKNIYTCACGAGCGCDTVAPEPGKCACGKEMVERKVIAEDAEKLYVCDCGPKCNCTGVSEYGDKCSCGKDLKAYPKAKKAGCACCQKKG